MGWDRGFFGGRVAGAGMVPDRRVSFERFVRKAETPFKVASLFRRVRHRRGFVFGVSDRESARFRDRLGRLSSLSRSVDSRKLGICGRFSLDYDARASPLSSHVPRVVGYLRRAGLPGLRRRQTRCPRVLRRLESRFAALFDRPTPSNLWQGGVPRGHRVRPFGVCRETGRAPTSRLGSRLCREQFLRALGCVERLLLRRHSFPRQTQPRYAHRPGQTGIGVRGSPRTLEHHNRIVHPFFKHSSSESFCFHCLIEFRSTSRRGQRANATVKTKRRRRASSSSWSWR